MPSLPDSLNTALTAAGIPPDASISTTVLPSLAYTLDSGTPEADSQGQDVTRYALALTVNAPNLNQAQTLLSKSRLALTTYSDTVIRSISQKPADNPSSAAYGYTGSQTYSVLAVTPVSRRHDGRGGGGLRGTAPVTFTPHP